MTNEYSDRSGPEDHAAMIVSLSTAASPNMAVSLGGRPEMTIEDCAMACRNLRDPYYSAAFYRWAHDESRRPLLYERLMARALVWARRERWPYKVARREWIEEMVDLVLKEQISRKLTDVLRAGYFGVSEVTWHKKMDRPHKRLSGIFDAWVSGACTHINRGRVA